MHNIYVKIFKTFKTSPLCLFGNTYIEKVIKKCMGTINSNFVEWLPLAKKQSETHKGLGSLFANTLFLKLSKG